MNRASGHLHDQTLRHWLLWPGTALLGLGLLLWMLAGYPAGFLSLNHWGSQWPAWLWTHLTLLGDSRVALALALPLAIRDRAFAWRVVLLLVVGGVATHLLKALFAMPRPPALLSTEQFHLIGPALTKGSFPSGHSLTAFSLAGLLVAWSRCLGLRVLWLVLAAWAAATRFFLGVHWPVDVLSGSGLGLMLAWVAIRLGNRLPWGERTAPWRVWLTLFLLSTLSLYGYDGRYEENRHSGTVLMVIILLTSGWAWMRRGRRAVE